MDCALDEVGAIWTPSPVVCPYLADTEVLAVCAGGSQAAVVEGVPYGLIQDAIDVSDPGDTVFVCPGVYTERLALADRTLAAADPSPGATVLTHAGDEREVYMPANDAVLRGLTFTGWRGFELSTAGTLVGECLSGERSRQQVLYSTHASGEVTLRHSTFYDSSGFMVGGNGTALVEDSEFVDSPYRRYGAVIQAVDLTVRPRLGSRFPAGTWSSSSAGSRTTIRTAPPEWRSTRRTPRSGTAPS